MNVISENLDGLWDWSVEHYSLPGAKEVLLDAQDQFSLNINILLWCCWHGENGRKLSELEMRNALEISNNWSENITVPLRHARRTLKHPQFRNLTNKIDSEDLYETIKHSELMAEKQELSLYALIGYDKNETRENAVSETQISPKCEPAIAQVNARRNIAIYLALARVAQLENFSISIIEVILDKILPVRT